MKTRTLKFLFTAAMAMTLASCGGEAKLEKTYITFITVGEKAAVFEKEYDGEKANFSLDSCKTNSDGQLVLKWYSISTNEQNEEVKTALEDAPINAGKYMIEVSVETTKKFEARTVHEYFEIKKAAIPESWVTKAADFPAKILYTESGSGRRVTRTATPESVQAVKDNVVVKKGETTWVLDEDYSVAVAVANATSANITIKALKEVNYSSIVLHAEAEKAPAE